MINFILSLKNTLPVLDFLKGLKLFIKNVHKDSIKRFFREPKMDLSHHHHGTIFDMFIFKNAK